MQIHQLQIQHIASEDRLLLRINTTENITLQCYLTRRYTKLLAGVIIDLLNKSANVASFDDAHTKQTALAFEQESISRKFDYSQKANDESTKSKPVNDEQQQPILLHNIKIKKAKSADTLILCLDSDDGAGIQLPASNELLHLLYKLLQDGVKAAEWGLNINELSLETTSTIPNKQLN